MYFYASLSKGHRVPFVPSWPGNKIATAPHKRTEEDSQCDLQSLGFLMTKQTLSLHFSLPYFSEIKEKATVKQSMPSSSHLMVCGWAAGWDKKFCHNPCCCLLWRVWALQSAPLEIAIISFASHCTPSCLVCPRLRTLVWVGQTWVRHCPHLPHNICTPTRVVSQAGQAGGRL